MGVERLVQNWKVSNTDGNDIFESCLHMWKIPYTIIIYTKQYLKGLFGDRNVIGFAVCTMV